MLGQMQSRPLLISTILTHAERMHPTADIVSRHVDGAMSRATYRDLAARARKLARALRRLGVGAGGRVGTLAWNSQRHVEAYYAISGMGAVCNTVNPRLHADDICYIVGHSGDTLMLADLSFAETIARNCANMASVRAIVWLCEPHQMPDVQLPPGMEGLCYETIVAAEPDDFAWPEFDENTASALCYTSGTTGRPKGVLYSHRSTILHAMAINMADALALRATDRFLPVVPMFHVNGWGSPYTALMAGASMVMPGRHLDGASLARLMNEERVTTTAGVPTVWMGLLQHCRATGEKLTTVKRIMTGGSACPMLLVQAFREEHGIEVEQGWGMTELSPVGTYQRPKAAHLGYDAEQRDRLALKQGRALFGCDMKITGDDGQDLPWDGVAFGDLKVRGLWVLDSYFGQGPGSAVDADGWFATGDVATIDPDGVMEITDRSKDVIKSGGEWISSIALENIAVGHPNVAEAAVIAARHAKWDERPLLLVLPKAGATVEPASVMALFEGQVPKWWYPDAVVVVDALPHTATGKLKKVAIREQWGDYLLKAGS